MSPRGPRDDSVPGATASATAPPETVAQRDCVAWSRYWASGALHSCPAAFTGNYGEQLSTLWREFFSGLPPDACVLDIGTGNGAIAFIARETAESLGRRYAIEAIDAADIDPRRAAAAHGLVVGEIVFRGRTACEHTAYPAATFDAVSSQYVLEYTHIGATVVELARILKPQGRALFVIHHADSRALATTRAELDAFNFLRHEAPIVGAARRLIQRGRSARSDVRDLERTLQRVVGYARSREHAGFVEAIAAQVATALRETRDLGRVAALQRLDALTAEMAAHRDRLGAILLAAQTVEGIRALEETFARAGFRTEPASELKVRGDDLVGWVLRATNP